MRFKLTLEVNKHKFGSAIPLNYQYEQSAVIYKILSEANNEYTKWLHDNGYFRDRKQFKLFTYSRLQIPLYKIRKSDERLIINSNTIEWYISFLPEKSTETFIKGIFMNRIFQIGDKRSKAEFAVQHIEVLPMPEFTKDTIFETLSPICISKREINNRTSYLSPKDIYAKEAIFTSLVNRYEAFYNRPYSGSNYFDFKVLDEPKSVLVKIKSGTPQETKVRGFMCKFRAIGDNELVKIMYENGAASKNSQGFGMVHVM